MVHIRDDKVGMYSLEAIYNQNVTYVTCIEIYVFGVKKMFVCLSSNYCRNISLVFEIGDPCLHLFLGGISCFEM